MNFWGPFLQTFQQPLTKKEEDYYLARLQEDDEEKKDEAKRILIERNLRLVAHIAKKYQGYKLSKLLMADAQKRMELAGCENITLEVRVSNVVAINLYKSCGFNIVATRKRYYENGEDAYLMLKEL